MLVANNAQTNALQARRPPGGLAGVRLVRYEPWPFENPSLRGHATIDFSGWTVARIPIFRRNDGSVSAGSPSAPEVDREGVQQRDAAGKRRFWSVISFTSDGKARWEKAVLAALAAAGVVP